MQFIWPPTNTPVDRTTGCGPPAMKAAARKFLVLQDNGYVYHANFSGADQYDPDIVLRSYKGKARLLLPILTGGRGVPQTLIARVGSKAPLRTKSKAGSQ